MYEKKIADDEIVEVKCIHFGEEINKEKGAGVQGKAADQRLSAKTISEKGTYQKSLEKQTKRGRNSFATLFNREKRLQEFEMAQCPLETELYAGPFDLAEEAINVEALNHTYRSETFKDMNPEIQDSYSKSPQNLMDDEDFVAAVEDVHSWLGQILRQEQY